VDRIQDLRDKAAARLRKARKARAEVIDKATMLDSQLKAARDAYRAAQNDPSITSKERKALRSEANRLAAEAREANDALRAAERMECMAVEDAQWLKYTSNCYRMRRRV